MKVSGFGLFQPVNAGSRIEAKMEIAERHLNKSHGANLIKLLGDYLFAKSINSGVFKLFLLATLKTVFKNFATLGKSCDPQNVKIPHKKLYFRLLK